MRVQVVVHTHNYDLEVNDVRPIDYLLENHPSVLKWVNLASNPALTPAFIEKYIDYDSPAVPSDSVGNDYKLSIYNLAVNPAFTPALITKYEDYISAEELWCDVATNPSLDEALLNRLKSILLVREIDCIEENPSLPPKFILKNWDDFNWFGEDLVMSLPIHLIHKYIGDTGVTLNDELGIDFNRKIRMLSSNPNLTHELIDKYIESWDWDVMCANPSVIRRGDIGYLVSFLGDEWNWDTFASNPALTPELIDKYFEKFDKTIISVNPALTPKLIEKYMSKLDVWYLCINPSFTLRLIDKYKAVENHNYSWERLSQNPNINTQLIRTALHAGLPLDNWLLSQNPALFEEEWGLVNHMEVLR